MLASCIPSTCEEHFLQVWASLVEVVCVEISPENILAVHIVCAKKCPDQSCVRVTLFRSIDNILRDKEGFMLHFPTTIQCQPPPGWDSYQPECAEFL